jgi:hypothetical protein
MQATGPQAGTGTIDPSVDDETEPLRLVFAMDAQQFFEYALELLHEHRPHFQDYPIIDRLARIGLSPDEKFDFQQADETVRAALTRAVPIAQKQITDKQTSLGSNVNGWRMTADNIGNYGTSYLVRVRRTDRPRSQPAGRRDLPAALHRRRRQTHQRREPLHLAPDQG